MHVDCPPPLSTPTIASALLWRDPAFLTRGGCALPGQVVHASSTSRFGSLASVTTWTVHDCSLEPLCMTALPYVPGMSRQTSTGVPVIMTLIVFQKPSQAGCLAGHTSNVATSNACTCRNLACHGRKSCGLHAVGRGGSTGVIDPHAWLPVVISHNRSPWHVGCCEVLPAHEERLPH